MQPERTFELVQNQRVQILECTKRCSIVLGKLATLVGEMEEMPVERFENQAALLLSEVNRQGKAAYCNTSILIALLKGEVTEG